MIAALALWFLGGLFTGAAAFFTAILMTPPQPAAPSEPDAIVVRCTSCRRQLAFHELRRSRQGAPAFLSYEELEELNAIAMALAAAVTGPVPQEVMVTAHARNLLSLASMVVERKKDEGRSFDLHRERVVAAWERVHEKLESAEGNRAQTETLMRLGVTQSGRIRT